MDRCQCLFTEVLLDPKTPRCPRPILLFTKAWETETSGDQDLRPFRDVPNALRTFYGAEHKGHRDIRDRDEARVRCLQCSEQGAPYLPPFESSCPSQSAMQSKKNIVICKLEALYFSNLSCPKNIIALRKLQIMSLQQSSLDLVVKMKTPLCQSQKKQKLKQGLHSVNSFLKEKIKDKKKKNNEKTTSILSISV